MKIIIAEKISQTGEKLLAEEPGWAVISPEQFASSPDEHLKDADALVVRSAVQADSKMLEKAPRLRVIGRAGVGVDNVDVEFATRKGIVVMNTPGANAIAVAEHTIGLMVALARHIPHADQSTRAGRWEKKKLQGTELSGKTLGIIGLGRVGMEVARRAAAMNMKVVAYDPYVSANVAREVNVSLGSLDALYSSADYISLHLGLTSQTADMIHGEAIRKMKRGVRIVNCARGELIDEAALAQALESGQVAGAALDVFVKEPPKDNPLLRLNNVIATPHIAGSTHEAQEAVGYQIAVQIREYLRKAIAQNAVNIPSLSDIEYQQIQPYLQLAERTSSLLAQLLDGNLEEIRISYSGSIAKWKTALLRSAAIKGVLQHSSPEVVNLVNADAQAQTRGIHITETHEESSALVERNVLSVHLKGGRFEVSAQGTVVHGSSPRITELNNIEIESPLDGNLIIVNNKDLPGVIGSIGSTLGRNNINIARFALGREACANKTAALVQPAGHTPAQRNAIAIIQTDTRATESVLDQLRQLPAIVSARAVALE